MIRKFLLLFLLPAFLLCQQQAPKEMKVIIDAGHGGYDAGAVSNRGTKEKDVALEIALLLKNYIENLSGLPVQAILTRSEDKFVPLIDRVSLANKSEGDLFISLHMNASPSRRDTGFEVYFYDSTGDAETSAVAKRENEPNGVVDSKDKNTPLYILWDLAQNEFSKESSEASDVIQAALDGALNENSETSLKLRNRGVKQADFLVLNGMKMPSVLLEMGFLTNNGDEEKFKKKEFKERYAEAIASAVRRICRKFDKKSETTVK